MSRLLTVNGTPYEYPNPGEPSGWGEGATLWAQAVTDVLDSVAGTGDILLTSFTIANNQSSAANVTGLSFSSATVRAADVTYSIIRTTDSVTTGLAETGTISLVFDNGASSTNKWSIVQEQNGNAAVYFTCTDAGQVQYTSSNVSGSSYVGTMKFKASALPI